MQANTQAERPEMQWINVWTEEELPKLHMQVINSYLKCDSQPALETTVEFAKFLRSVGLSADNYAFLLALLKEENSNVTEALLGNSKAFDIHPITVSDVNTLGKHLDKETGQEDSLNRCILDILDKISELEVLEDYTRDMEEVAIHANEIRNFFFDETKSMKDVIPPVHLVRMEFKKFEVFARGKTKVKTSWKKTGAA